MRTLSSAALTALSSSPCPLAVLVEMDLTASLNLCSASINLTLNGVSYLGTGGLGKVEAVQQSPSEMKQLKFELSGVPSSSVALALSEPVQGKAGRIKLAIFDPATYQALDTRLCWAGLLDVMAIDEGPATSVISVTAENAGIDLLRPYTSLLSDSEQQRLYPGDVFFQYMADQVDQRIVWPSKDWGRK